MARFERNEPHSERRGAGSARKGGGQRDFRGSLVPLDVVVEVRRARGDGDAAAAWVASQQLALVTLPQLKAAGLSKYQVARRCRKGTMHRIHRSVYLFGARVMVPRAAELAAVMACGQHAVISHRSAAALWGLLDPPESYVEVTVIGRSRRPQPGINLHRVDHLHAEDRTTKSGIPVTTPARTIVDLADDRDLERTLNEARVQRLIDDPQLQDSLIRAGPRKGIAHLRLLLNSQADSDYTRSEAERRMRRLLKEAGLPAPRCNIKVLGREVDFLWAQQKVIVEVDGYQFHGHRAAFERDRRKDMALIAAGYRVIRISWRQLTNERLAVAVAIASALAMAAAT